MPLPSQRTQETAERPPARIRDIRPCGNRLHKICRCHVPAGDAHLVHQCWCERTWMDAAPVERGGYDEDGPAVDLLASA